MSVRGTARGVPVALVDFGMASAGGMPMWMRMVKWKGGEDVGLETLEVAVGVEPMAEALPRDVSAGVARVVFL